MKAVLRTLITMHPPSLRSFCRSIYPLRRRRFHSHLLASAELWHNSRPAGVSAMPTRARFMARTSRRHFVQGLAAGGVVAGAGLQAGRLLAMEPPQHTVLAGTDFDLAIGESIVNYTGRNRPAITVNGSLPAPLLRWREGTTVTLRVTNALPPGSVHGDLTSLHWHGILLP